LIPTTRVCLLVAAACLAQASPIEQRGNAAWPTRNHLRIAVQVDLPSGRPVLLTHDVPAGFNPDSVRVIRSTSPEVIPAKVEWRVPQMKVSWLSKGPGAYHAYFDIGRAGETARLAEPAMVGTGDPISYGRASVRGHLGVGLWSHPAALDFDGDGNIDLVVSCAGPSAGTYLFRNLGGN